jgi:DNA-binding MarR family transcriptional regulator
MSGTSIIDDPRITLFGRVVEAYAYLRHQLDEEMQQEVGLPLLWYGVLLHVGRSPEGVRPISELTQATAFTSGGVTRLVDRMQAAGYVERLPCPTDRRVQYVGLTDKGREMLERASEIHIRGIEEHMLDRLTPDEGRELDRLLSMLVP